EPSHRRGGPCRSPRGHDEGKPCGRGLISTALATLIATFLNGSVVVAEGAKPDQDLLHACSDAWRDKPPSERLPSLDDTHDPRTGKELSQTDGAKRTR